MLQRVVFEPERRQQRTASPGTAYYSGPGGGGERSSCCFVDLVSNERMTEETWSQDVRHVVLTARKEEGALEYSPGDVLALYPHNPDDDVCRCCLSLVYYYRY